MDYRGIITQGYYIDTGGQNKLMIITWGYIGVLAAIVEIFNIVSETAYFQIMQMKNIMFGKIKTTNSKHAIKQTQEVKF